MFRRAFATLVVLTLLATSLAAQDRPKGEAGASLQIASLKVGQAGRFASWSRPGPREMGRWSLYPFKVKEVRGDDLLVTHTDKEVPAYDLLVKGLPAAYVAARKAGGRADLGGVYKVTGATKGRGRHFVVERVGR
jgi:hypothetical protein